MTAHQAAFPVAVLCRVLKVSTSGYYASLKRSPSARACRDAALLTAIRASHARSDATYGAPRVHEDLAEAGERVGRKRVARLMRSAGLTGVSNRKGPPRPKRTVPEAPQAPDLIRRDFTATAPDALWAADITYVPTYAGFLYLAVVLDAFSRRVVGWAMGTTLKATLVLDALQMAATYNIGRSHLTVKAGLGNPDTTRRPRAVRAHVAPCTKLVRGPRSRTPAPPRAAHGTGSEPAPAGGVVA